MLEEIWDFKLYSATTFTLTAGHIFEAIFILILGIIIARIIKIYIGKRITKYSRRISKHHNLLIQKITYYILVIIVVYISLSMLNIPLTTVKFLAGGIGIGIGLGLKSYINNFWSGLVIIFEKPFKVGDVVEIKGTVGRIWDINFRSITIHTEENLDIIIPNSVVLDESIVNWTKDDKVILSNVKIGIGYDSDPIAAAEIIKESVSKVNGILSKPMQPFILFKEHGNSALIFEVFFSIRVTNKLERWEYESDVNFAINKALRDNNIKIPYPQLDLHFERKEVKL